MIGPAGGSINTVEDEVFFHEFQPIWSTEKEEVFAYEALLRTKSHINPLMVFKSGRERGFLYELDTASISNAIREYPERYLQSCCLFVNIFPSTLIHPKFPAFIHKLIEKHPAIKGRIVFEISEDPIESPLWNNPLFTTRIDLLKKLKFLIALDDLSISSESEKKILNSKPDFAKLDRSCSENLAQSSKKQKTIFSFLSKAIRNSVVVLEGVEQEEDLLAAARLGIPAVQGYYIAKPHRLV